MGRSQVYYGLDLSSTSWEVQQSHYAEQLSFSIQSFTNQINFLRWPGPREAPKPASVCPQHEGLLLLLPLQHRNPAHHWVSCGVVNNQCVSSNEGLLLLLPLQRRTPHPIWWVLECQQPVCVLNMKDFSSCFLFLYNGNNTLKNKCTERESAEEGGGCGGSVDGFLFLLQSSCR